MDDEDAAGPTVPGLPGKKPAWMAQTVAAPTPAGAPPPPAISVFDPPERRYTERAELGRGGMGRVVEAHDRALDRAVAIKQSLAASPTDLARFEREVRITAKLQHPSVVPIHDVGRDAEGRPYYVMRKIDGEALADAVGRADDVRARLALVPSILGAIDACAYAHARRVVHRDIKPWNILLGPYGETLLIDWGIARELDEEEPAPEVDAADTNPQLTRVGSAYGTPGFLSPEQARGEPVDARTDVYSLGATLYFVLTRAVPFGVEKPTLAIEAVAAGQSPDFAAIPDEVPRELAAITTKAMAPAPGARYADAGELAADLRRFLAGQLVAAHVYTTGERILRWLRHHRLAAAIAAIAVAAITSISIVAVRRVVAERDQATAAKVAEQQARALAEQRADAKLVDRARSLLASDPTSALGVLRTLRADSPAWSTVRPIVRAAIPSGVERSIGKLSKWVAALAMAPDGTRVAASSGRGIVVYTLAGSASRTFAEDAAVTQLRWRDDHTIVYAQRTEGAPGTAGLLDTTTGAVTPLTIPPFSQLEIAGADLVVLGMDGSVITSSPGGERRTLVASGATGLDERAGRIVIAEPTRITILDGARTTTIDVPAPAARGVRLSDTGERVIVLSPGLVREWIVGQATPHATWPRATTGLATVEYARDEPLAWTSADGIEALEKERAAPRWLVRERVPGVLPEHILPVRRGAVLVTDNGAVAIATELGVVALPHRPLAVTRATVDASGDRLVLGTDNGEILVLDLATAWPRIVPVLPEERLAAISGGRALLLGQQVTLVELATGHRTALGGPRGACGLLGDNEVVVVCQSDREVEVMDLGGKRIALLEETVALFLGHRSVTYADARGEVWQLDIDPPRAPRRLGTVGDVANAIVQLDVIETDVVARVHSAAGSRTTLLAGGTQRPLALDVPGLAELQGRSADGAYWLITRADGQLWRAVAGSPATRVELGYEVANAVVHADGIWAFGDSVMTELLPTGTLVRAMGVHHAGRLWKVAEGVVMADPEGIVELAPGSGLRRVLRAPGRAREVAATRDGSTIAARMQLDEDHAVIAVWNDPVPPDETRSYLDRVTNARLLDGSDVITWDPTH